MKLYVVYFRTMQDSPEVKIVSLTTSKKKADEKFAEAKKWEEEWMDEESGNWAEACMEEFETQFDVTSGETWYVVVETDWLEVVDTDVFIFREHDQAVDAIETEKAIIKMLDDGMVPFDEDETFEESMHICNDDVMHDVYFSIEPVVLQ